MRRRSLLSATNKREGYITTQATAKSLTYNGSSLELVTAAYGSGTILYSLDNTSFSSSIPTAVNAGSYTVYYKAAESRFFTESPVYNVSCSISRASGYISTEPTPKTLTYTGSAQTLLNGGSGSGTMQYSLTSNANFSTTIPTGTNAGTYTVYYKAAQSTNYTETSVYSKQVTISPKSVTATVTLSQTSYTYSGSACQPTPTVKDGSTTIPTSEYTVSYSNNVNAGTATCTISDKANGNYTVSGSATFTINKASLSSVTITLSWTSKPYNGSAQVPTATVKSGNTTLTSGTHYSLSYTNSSSKNTGTYTITASPTSNYSFTNVSANYSITKIDPTIVEPTAKTGLVYDGNAKTLLNPGSNTTPGSFSYSGNSLTNANTYYPTWSFTPTDTTNYNSKSGTITVTIAKLALSSVTNTLSWTSKSYNGSVQVPTATVKNGNTTLTSGTHYTLSYSNSSSKNAGTYTITAVATSNYSFNNVAASYSITKIDPNYTAPTTKTGLVYNGSAQNLANAGSNTTPGSFSYRADDSYGSYASSIPTKTNAGGYTVYWRFSPTDTTNYNAASGYFYTTIAKKDPTYTAPTAKTGLVYNGNSQTLVNDGSNTTAGAFSYSNKSGTDATTYYLTWTFTPTDTTNYNTKSGTLTVTIDKAPGSVTAPTAKSGLVYDGNRKDLVNVGTSSTGTVYHKVESDSWNTSSPLRWLAGTYTVYYYSKGDSNHYDTSIYSITSTIALKDPVITYPSVKSGLVYNGSALYLVNGGLYNISGTSEFNLNGGSYSSTTTPTGTNAATYTVGWKFTPDNSNYKSVSGTLYPVISRLSISPSVSMSSWTYGGTASNPSVSGNTGNGSVTYSYKVNGAADNTYTTTKPSTANTYVVRAVIAQTTNYSGATVTNIFYIYRAYPPITTPPAAKSLTYTGSAQALITGGVSSISGTWQYNLNDGTYSSSIPTGTNVQVSSTSSTYKVGWKFTPTDTTNYSTASSTINVHISKANPSYTAPTATSPTYNVNGASLYLTTTGSTSHGTIQYSSNNSSWSTSRCTGINAGSYTTYWRLVGDSNHNDVSSTSITTTISKANSVISFSGNGTVREDLTMTKAASRTRGDGTITYSSNNTSKATVNNNGTVTGVSPGSCTITVTTSATTNYNAASASYTLTVQQGYVDLGLSSGIRWAKRNIGAGAISDVGLYYAWGDPTGHAASSGYNWGSGNDTQPYVNLTGGVRSLTTDLIDSQDVAYRNWADEWRMPTTTQWNELVTGTNVTFTTMDGVSGMKCTNKSNSSKYIFIPCGGWLKNACANLGSNKGRYWLRSVGGTPAEQGSSGYFVPSETRATTANAAKYLGCPVRAVYNPTAA